MIEFPELFVCIDVYNNFNKSCFYMRVDSSRVTVDADNRNICFYYLAF